MLPLLLAFGLARARLHQPHQLSVSGAAAGANPDVDAWHDQEKARIEAECDEMMRKIWAEKRQKLQDLVDAARRRVADEERALADARARAQAELGHLEKEKADVADVKPVRLGPSEDRIDAARVR